MLLLGRDFSLDLDEGRRSIRTGLLTILGVYLVGQVVLAAVYSGDPLPEIVVIAQGLGVWLVTLLICVVMFGPVEQPFGRPEPARLHDARSVGPATWDTDVAQKLAGHIAQGTLATPGLSVARLAQLIGCAPHTLRKVIHGQLGFRHFNEFVNYYRVDAAARRLESESTPILDIALGVGFGSLSPFNLAFKRRFGMTPSQFRTRSATSTVD